MLGRKPGGLELKSTVSYLPEDAGTYENITEYEFLKRVSRIYFGRTREAEEALELGLKIAELAAESTRRRRTTARG